MSTSDVYLSDSDSDISPKGLKGLMISLGKRALYPLIFFFLGIFGLTLDSDSDSVSDMNSHFDSLWTLFYPVVGFYYNNPPCYQDPPFKKRLLSHRYLFRTDLVVLKTFQGLGGSTSKERVNRSFRGF